MNKIRNQKISQFIKILFLFIILTCVVFLLKTIYDFKSPPCSFQRVLANAKAIQVLDRNGESLNMTYQNRWNTHDLVPIHSIPSFLKSAFIFSEDKRFYQHRGIDWKARTVALFINFKKRRAVRGASTISEQVVRIIHPRPRTVWSRWLEGWEAMRLEKCVKKESILEFYLNQVPYAANRRGVVQAAHYYFNRDLSTLNKKEMLALVVLIRAPSRMDLLKNTKRVEFLVKRLSKKLVGKGLLTEKERNQLLRQKFKFERPSLIVDAPHFIRYVTQQSNLNSVDSPKLVTTLDSSLQHRVHTLLEERLALLQGKQVKNGSVLVVDHTTGDIVSWVVSGEQGDEVMGSFIDTVITPRQPASSLKPFLYALALEKGWSAATLIDDSPLAESVGSGLHQYQNYSRFHYGFVTVREALGNSLNVPAVKALHFVGVGDYFNLLKRLGFDSLSRSVSFYGNGLALGNGEVTLYELVQAYSVLANRGKFKPLRVFQSSQSNEKTQFFSEEVSSLIANILSDSKARRLEFGKDSVLNFPLQTAVKTGTSSDYRDAWAVGFNYRYTVGVWMGNINYASSDGVTGSIGPALLLRSVFSELTKNVGTKPLYLSPKLKQREIMLHCRGRSSCPKKMEWFISKEPLIKGASSSLSNRIILRRPTEGLHLAYDPHLPDSSQVFEFYLQGVKQDDHVTWRIDEEEVIASGARYRWFLRRGRHCVSAAVLRKNKRIANVKRVCFFVK